MPIRNNREYRTAVNFETHDDDNFIVTGYAATFDEYVLFTDEDGTEYRERIERDAFNETDFSDVIFQYDHSGMVYARNSNGTLSLEVDDHGLKIRADLSTTQNARDLFYSIKSGLITKMSFAFTVAENRYDRATNTRIIEKIRKLYDVSAVSYPANPGTEIGLSARDVFHGFVESEKQEMLAAEKRQLDIKKTKLKMKISEETNYVN